MKNSKNLGIMMDHSVAVLIDASGVAVVPDTIYALKRIREKQENDGLDESMQQNVEKQQLAEYYQNLIEIFQQYDRVLLFGPTEAKSELFNYAKTSKQAGKTKIEIGTTDKMTRNQRNAFVRSYFGDKSEQK